LFKDCGLVRGYIKIFSYQPIIKMINGWISYIVIRKFVPILMYLRRSKMSQDSNDGLAVDGLKTNSQKGVRSFLDDDGDDDSHLSDKRHYKQSTFKDEPVPSITGK
jgi:hypothetical protein